ncbi:MAG: helix-turn-helix transcriptional regulator [Coriobacteriales bacterium]|nr:helix-turn-helix transcriptional regulator [Coriobacteriales bacterium]
MCPSIECRRADARALLSRRETEVLFLLAKGRNAAYIQERLYISEGTARTHMRHIYKKLNIHTQQELIDMIDSIELTESPTDQSDRDSPPPPSLLLRPVQREVP